MNEIIIIERKVVFFWHFTKSVPPFLQARFNFWYLKITKISGDLEASQIVPNDILFSVWMVHCIHAVPHPFYVSDTIYAVSIFLVDTAQILILQMLGVRVVKEGFLMSHPCSLCSRSFYTLP